MPARGVPIRCEGCHKLIWIIPGVSRHVEYKPGLWFCDECGNLPHIYTLEEFERSEKE